MDSNHDRYERMDEDENEGRGGRCRWTCSSNKLFAALVISIEVVGIAIVLMVALWRSFYENGFNWYSDDHDQIFNYHPLFMVTSLLFLYSNGALIWRVFKTGDRLAVKIIHGVVQLLAFSLAVFGVRAAWLAHDKKAEQDAASNTTPSPDKRYHLTSLHSWAGLSILIIFALQWLLGLLLLLPSSFKWARCKPLSIIESLYKPLHALKGGWFVVWISATVLMGICIDARSVFKALKAETWLVNIIGFLVIIFTTLVLYTVQSPSFSRSALIQIGRSGRACERSEVGCLAEPGPMSTLDDDERPIIDGDSTRARTSSGSRGAAPFGQGSRTQSKEPVADRAK